ncbi:hypothetical protein ACFWIK_00970 [Streptomyces anthocyanicus]|uniref:hypothetical protein n=1 Tax=Streptomyces anthocyanicus TaxID=68174 RepID=UPI00364BD3C3
MKPGHEMGYCWEKFGDRQLHCCRPPDHEDDDGEGGHWTPYGGGPVEFRSRLTPRP